MALFFVFKAQRDTTAPGFTWTSQFFYNVLYLLKSQTTKLSRSIYHSSKETSKTLWN